MKLRRILPVLFFLFALNLSAGAQVANREEFKKDLAQKTRSWTNKNFDKDDDRDDSDKFIPIIFALTVLLTLRKTLRQEAKLDKWQTRLRQGIGAAVILAAIDWTFSIHLVGQWLWHLYLLGLAYLLHTEPDFKTRKPLALALLPYVVIGFIKDLLATVAPGFFPTIAGYSSSLTSLSFVWFFVMLIMGNKQLKVLAKEREKLRLEEQMNKAIAARKVELESEVAERTNELIKQKEELELALAELKSTQDQLIQQEKLASLGELTAGIAHEIQNPLNFVNNFSEVSIELLDELETEIENNDLEEVKAIAGDIKQNLRKINEHGKRADGIVKGMLQHSRKSTGQKEPTDINALADEYLRLSYHGLRAKDKSFNASLKLQLDKELPPVQAIPQELGRVLLNMFNNSFYSVSKKKKERPEGYEPEVSVTTSLAELDGNAGVRILIRDNGLGIPQKVLDKIYQPFFTTKPAGEGTGLGLSLSYDIITKVHGGELKVDTLEGEFAAFELILPLA